MIKRIKTLMARKMGVAPYLHDYDEAVPKGMGIYDRGQRDHSEALGHGRYKNQGLTRYIEHMLNQEKAGKFRFDSRK